MVTPEFFMWAFLGLFLVIMGVLIARLVFVVVVDSHEIGYEFNRKTGQILVLDRAGYFIVRPFFTSIKKIDCREIEVRIESDNKILAVKNVSFRKSPEGVLQFIELKGRRNYDLNTLSEILKGYVFEDCATSHYSERLLQEKYKFLNIFKKETEILSIPP